MSAARAAGWLAVLLLLAGATWRAGEGAEAAAARAGTPDRGARAAVVPRLLGPFANLAASAQWVRFHLARRAGRLELALARAEVALRLDPVSPEGWMALASHLAFDRASAAREPDPARRRSFVRAGLDVAARGEARSSHPEELAYLRGLILSFRVAEQPDLDWPGGPEAAWRAAAEHFARAAALGHPAAAVLEELARERLAAGAGGD